MSNFAFSTEGLFSEIYQNRHAYLEFETDNQQFRDIEENCSGSDMGSSYESALEWAKQRSDRLHEEASAHVEDYHYCLPMGCCRYEVTSEVIVYETTRGTVFLRFKDGTSGVMLPKKREFGNHHQSIAFAMSGVVVPPPCYDKDPEVRKLAMADRNAVMDSVLVPLGFPPQETWEETSDRLKKMRERLRELPEEEDLEYYEDEYDYDYDEE